MQERVIMKFNGVDNPGTEFVNSIDLIRAFEISN